MILVRAKGKGFEQVTQKTLTAPPREGSKAKARRVSQRTALRLARLGKHDELAEFGVQAAPRERVPDGKFATDWKVQRSADGAPVLQPVLQDLEAPRVLTAVEKLGTIGLTPQDLKELIGV